MKTVYIQNICTNCLQWLVNNESDHTEEEKQTMFNTLDQWSKDKYIPAGLSDNLEPSFSWHTCDICHALPGDRYEYNFFDESK